jgi:hypothetical protein
VNLPTQNQVNAATRHIISAVGGAIIMFGLSSKINIDTLTVAINAFGSIINSVVIIVGVVAPLLSGYFASRSASPASQAASMAANVPGTVIVTSPEIAKATPDSPNVVSNTEVKVVQK